jgi:hypothetical protein
MKRRRLSGYQIISFLSRDKMPNDEFRKQIEEQFAIGLAYEINHAGLEKLEEFARQSAQVELLDEFIVFQARTLGWRIVLCDVALSRIDSWNLDPRGPELFEKLGAAMAYTARTLQRKAKVPFSDPLLPEYRDTFVREFRLLRNQLRSSFASQRRPPTLAVAGKWVEQRVKQSPESFQLLFANLGSFMDYLDNLGKIGGAPADRFANGAVPPAELFHSWHGWRLSRDPETVRQTISTLPRSKSPQKL